MRHQFEPPPREPNAGATGQSPPESPEPSDSYSDADSMMNEDPGGKVLDTGVWENDVLPIFYYNDLLVSRPGDTLGLNLFEPRYQEMCRRMAHDPRFLFMPNYEDYCCRVGDIGLVIRLTDLRQQPHGRSFLIRGCAEEYAAVGCTWVEPGTSGLHCARYFPLGHRLESLTHFEAQAFHAALLERGWFADRQRTWRLLLRPQGGGGKGEVLFGPFWPAGRTVVLLRPGAEALEAGQLQEAWAAAALSLGRPRFRSADFTTHVVHLLPRREAGRPLKTLCLELLHLAKVDGAGARSFAGLPEDGVPDEAAWRRLLSKARISAVHSAAASLPNVRLELCNVPQRYIDDCFPLLPGKDAEVQPAMRASNNTNVFFFSHLESIEVSEASAASAVGSLANCLNSLRLCILQRAHAAKTGLLASLEDDVFQMVADFVCPGITARA